MAAVQKARAKQHSRLKWIREGGANTRLFHIYANARRKKSFVSALHSDEGVATTQRDKMRVATEFFTKAVGTNSARSRRLNWAALGYSPFNLEDLDMPFTEQELFGTIKSVPSEKGPGPDGFIGIFTRNAGGLSRMISFKRPWDSIIIRHPKCTCSTKQTSYCYPKLRNRLQWQTIGPLV